MVEPLLPLEPSKARVGRPRDSGSRALEGNVYVLKTGIALEVATGAFGCNGVTCWRRLRD